MTNITDLREHLKEQAILQAKDGEVMRLHIENQKKKREVIYVKLFLCIEDNKVYVESKKETSGIELGKLIITNFPILKRAYAEQSDTIIITQVLHSYTLGEIIPH